MVILLQQIWGFCSNFVINKCWFIIPLQDFDFNDLSDSWTVGGGGGGGMVAGGMVAGGMVEIGLNSQLFFNMTIQIITNKESEMDLFFCFDLCKY